MQSADVFLDTAANTTGLTLAEETHYTQRNPCDSKRCKWREFPWHAKFFLKSGHMADEHKAHRAPHAGPKAAKKREKEGRGVPKSKGNNPKAFAIQSAGKTRRRVAHAMEKFG